MIFKIKPKDKIILISDALPIAHSAADIGSFMGQTIYLCENCAKTKSGTLAGSALFVFDIIKRLVNSGILDINEAFKMASENVSSNLKIRHGSMLEIDENFRISGMEK